jgi:hypothetical protein
MIMPSTKNLKVLKGDCKSCKFHGATFRDIKIFCNNINKIVDIQLCKSYEKCDEVIEELMEESQAEREVAEAGMQASIENESLDKVVDFFVSDNNWLKLRRILTKDVISTTVLLNYLEHNKEAKKRFMNALILMSNKELENL